jgi:hypothetical protein
MKLMQCLILAVNLAMTMRRKDMLGPMKVNTEEIITVN